MRRHLVHAMAAVIDVSSSLPAMALTKTISIPLDPSWPTGYWGCGSILPILYSNTYTTSFPGSIPPGSKVTSVRVTMPMRRSGSFSQSGDVDPTVTIAIAGQPIGAATAVSGYVACPYTLLDYHFDSSFANGFTAYNPTGANAATITVQGGVCATGCGVTVDAPVARVDVTYDPPPPAVFAITNTAPEADRRILISNVRTSYSYPYFQAAGGANDAEVTTSLRAHDANGNFQSGLTVYLRILDPADSAPYMNQPGNVLAHQGDNEGAAAVLDGPGVTVTSPGVYQATSGANGQVDFTLRLQSPFVAGDNYEVEASLDPAFPSGSTAKSGTLTAWKRVFIEKRRMLRNGLFLAQNAAAGDTFVVTRGNHWLGNRGDHDALSKNEKIVITHAPQLDRSDLNGGWYYETHTILSVQDLGNDTYRVNLGTKQGNTVIVEQLQHDYKTEVDDANIGDGVSKIDTLTLGANDYYDASPALATGDAFLQAFAENIYLPDSTTPGALTPVPFIETADEDVLQNLAEKWSAWW